MFCVLSDLITYSTVVLTVFCVLSDLIIYSTVVLTVFCVLSDLIMCLTAVPITPLTAFSGEQLHQILY